MLSPADGRIVAIQTTRDPYIDREALKISVFMNVFNVHSNRSPVDGEVKGRWYHAGSVLNAALEKASLENERNAIWLRTPDGQDVTSVQVAGLIARRILCYVNEGDTLSRGQRYGFIRFRSRVDLSAARLQGKGQSRRHGVGDGHHPGRVALNPSATIGPCPNSDPARRWSTLN